VCIEVNAQLFDGFLKNPIFALSSIIVIALNYMYASLGEENSINYLLVTGNYIFYRLSQNQGKNGKNVNNNECRCYILFLACQQFNKGPA